MYHRPSMTTSLSRGRTRTLRKATHTAVLLRAVKTTSPKSYCVRPNVGVVTPKTTYEFTVTMQAQKTAPPDLECKDKFLVQSVVIPFGSTEEDLKPNLFSKEIGGFIEENKLRVVLVSPTDSHHSLVLQPIDGGLDQSPPSDEDHKPREQGTSAHNSALSGGIENLHPAYVAKITDVENLKAKLIHLESKLNEAQKSILQLSDEKNSTIQENKKLRQEVLLLRRKYAAGARVGFPSLFVCFVALVALTLGYLIHS
ncbi:hypothetical protein Taro_044722 [Colocasia esculenta]|uniref:MSP domain-containing protein n=1 Tax=Colocasia esculenta TaxID=4460 RepID=A0A843WUR7_COLES|nr:hypothetical protein [Colocasia esculenta]